MPTAPITRNRWIRILAGLLLLASVGEFLMRGPIRFARQQMAWNDFLSPYIQSDAWIHGEDPYRASSIVRWWPRGNPQPEFVRREATDGSLPVKHGIPSLYPVTSLVVLAPFVSLEWTAAESLWIAVNTVLLLLAFIGLVAISGADWRSLRVQFFLAAALALAPLHTGMATGNPAVLAIAFTVGAVWAARIGKDVACGILLALAICLKPTIAICLVVYYVVRRRWKIAITASALTALIAAVAAGWLAHERVSWFASYVENNHKVLAPGGLGDFTGADPLRFNLIHTQVLFYSLSGSIPPARWAPFFLAGALFAVWFRLYVRRRCLASDSREDDVLEISTLFVLSLLPVYHRFYDAGLLLWPLMWSLLIAQSWRKRLLTLAAIFPFCMPGATILNQLKLQGCIPGYIAGSAWWNTMVMPHEIWSLIALSILLLFFMRFTSRSSARQCGDGKKRPESALTRCHQA